jgi:hypothetical protein
MDPNTAFEQVKDVLGRISLPEERPRRREPLGDLLRKKGLKGTFRRASRTCDALLIAEFGVLPTANAVVRQRCIVHGADPSWA